MSNEKSPRKVVLRKLRKAESFEKPKIKTKIVGLAVALLAFALVAPGLCAAIWDPEVPDRNEQPTTFDDPDGHTTDYDLPYDGWPDKLVPEKPSASGFNSDSFLV